MAEERTCKKHGSFTEDDWKTNSRNTPVCPECNKILTKPDSSSGEGGSEKEEEIESLDRKGQFKKYLKMAGVKGKNHKRGAITELCFRRDPDDPEVITDVMRKAKKDPDSIRLFLELWLSDTDGVDIDKYVKGESKEVEEEDGSPVEQFTSEMIDDMKQELEMKKFKKLRDMLSEDDEKSKSQGVRTVKRPMTDENGNIMKDEQGNTIYEQVEEPVTQEARVEKSSNDGINKVLTALIQSQGNMMKAMMENKGGGEDSKVNELRNEIGRLQDQYQENVVQREIDSLKEEVKKSQADPIQQVARLEQMKEKLGLGQGRWNKEQAEISMKKDALDQQMTVLQQGMQNLSKKTDTALNVLADQIKQQNRPQGQVRSNNITEGEAKEMMQESEFECPECGKTFDSKQALAAHSRVHK